MKEFKPNILYLSTTDTRSEKTNLTASCQEHNERG